MMCVSKQVNVYSWFGDDWPKVLLDGVVETLVEHGYSVNVAITDHFQPADWRGVSDKPVYIKRLALFEDATTGSFTGFDTGDFVGPRKVRCRELLPSALCRYVRKCQFREYYKEEPLRSKLRPFLYLEKAPLFLQPRLEQYRRITSSVPKMFFRGTLGRARRGVLARLGELCNGEPDVYFSEMCHYKLALGLPGFGNACHREIEAFGVGVPVIMPTLKNSFYNPLRPNVHYVASPVPLTAGSQSCAQAIRERFLEVIGDHDYLVHVRENALQWYREHVLLSNAIPLAARLLGYSWQT